MSEANTTRFPSSLRIWMIFLLILILCINHNLSLAYPMYDDPVFLDTMDDADFNRRDALSDSSQSKVIQPRFINRAHYAPRLYGHYTPNRRVLLIPVDKRTIPIELQKALYAHGIVGRRR